MAIINCSKLQVTQLENKNFDKQYKFLPFALKR